MALAGMLNSTVPRVTMPAAFWRGVVVVQKATPLASAPSA